MAIQMKAEWIAARFSIEDFLPPRNERFILVLE